MNPFIIRVPAFRYDIYTYLVRKELDKVKIQTSVKNLFNILINVTDNSGLCFCNKEQRISIIIINLLDRPIDTADSNVNLDNRLSIITTIRHEVQHACTNCWESMNATLHTLDDEPFVYFNDYVFKTIVAKYKFLIQSS